MNFVFYLFGDFVPSIILLKLILDGIESLNFLQLIFSNSLLCLAVLPVKTEFFLNLKHFRDYFL